MSVQVAIKLLAGYQVAAAPTNVRLMNASAPDVPFGYPMLTNIKPGLVGNISQADAQQSYLVGSIVALQNKDAANGAYISTDDDYYDHYMDPVEALEFDEVNQVPNNAAMGGIIFSVIITHNSW